MKEELFKASSAASQRALRHYLDSEHSQFFLHAGVSLELAGKATLAAIHPALIIDAKNFDSLLHVCGGSKHAQTPPWKLRTIGAYEVLERCSRIEPKLKTHSNELKALAEYRNSTSHLGSVPEADTRKIFGAYVQAISSLCEHSQVDLDEFFGVEFGNVVKKHLDDSSADAERIAVEKIAKARIDFASRFVDLPEGVRKAVFDALIAGSRSASPYDEANETCPACTEHGILAGTHDVYWDVDYDNEGYPSNAYPSVTLHAEMFWCPICGLELNSEDQLKAAGLPMAVSIEDVDPADFYEPSEDLRDY